jgi:hypothetical protein
VSDDELDLLAKKIVDEMVVRLALFLDKLEKAVNEQKEPETAV